MNNIKYIAKLFLLAACLASFFYFLMPYGMCLGPRDGDCKCDDYDSKRYDDKLQTEACCKFDYYQSVYYCISIEECRDRTINHYFDSYCHLSKIVGIILYVVSGLIVVVPLIITVYIYFREKVLQKIAQRRAQQIYQQQIQNYQRLREQDVRMQEHRRANDMKNELSQNLNSQPQICSICLEQFQRYIATVTRKCNHKFHRTCNQVWSQRSNQCPLCRAVQ